MVHIAARHCSANMSTMSLQRRSVKYHASQSNALKPSAILHDDSQNPIRSAEAEHACALAANQYNEGSVGRSSSFEMASVAITELRPRSASQFSVPPLCRSRRARSHPSSTRAEASSGGQPEPAPLAEPSPDSGVCNVSTDKSCTSYVAETLLPTTSGLYRVRAYRHWVSWIVWEIATHKRPGGGDRKSWHHRVSTYRCANRGAG